MSIDDGQSRTTIRHHGQIALAIGGHGCIIKNVILCDELFEARRRYLICIAKTSPIIAEK